MFEFTSQNDASALKILAIPAGLEPATTRLEGGVNSVFFQCFQGSFKSNKARKAVHSVSKFELLPLSLHCLSPARE